MMELSQSDKELMQEEGYRYGVCVKIPVHPDFEISLACSGEDKNWGDWTLIVNRNEKDITFEIFPEPQMHANREVLATADNIQRAISTCKLIFESEEQMDISWAITEYQWGDVSDCWYILSATAYTTLQAALLALNIMLKNEYERDNEFNPIEWHSGLRFVNDTDECPSSRITRMWNLTKITKD
jgi:hypothetical protein